jgi:hypothetical protein
LGLLPERLSHHERRDAAGLPPRDLLAGAMQLAMVRSAQRHSVFIADLAAEGARLGKRQMVRIGRLLRADQARLRADEFEVFLAGTA